MTDEADDPYSEREQTQIKHFVLEKYLQRFARIVGSWKSGILYVDGFSGPWKTAAGDLSDSSFAIALKELRAARETVRETFKKDLRIKCVFLEKDPASYELLRGYASRQTDVEVSPLNQRFEAAIPELVKIANACKDTHFPFILIDPKGWKGFSMEVIAPLIRVQPSEVLVNFMTGHIQRFIEDERDGVKASFRRLFGDDSYVERVEGLVGQDREDAMVESYAERLAAVGNFPYFSTALVLRPTQDRTNYHLIYATRDIKGIDVFKEAERKSLRLAETIRANAKKTKREHRSGQRELFSGEDIPETAYLSLLQNHFETKAAAALCRLTTGKNEVEYDSLYATALRYPTVQPTFLKDWLKERAELRTASSATTPLLRRGDIYRFAARNSDSRSNG